MAAMTTQPSSQPLTVSWRVIRGTALAFLAGMWLIALAVTSGNASLPYRGGPPQAIVVFSGEPERVTAAIALHRATKLPVFFTSASTEPDEAAQLLAEIEEGRYAYVGGRARDTFGNAVEAASWLRERNIRGVWLVTSEAHMPRAWLVLRHVWPEGHVIPYPVPSRFAPSYAGEWLRRHIVSLLADLGVLRLIARVAAALRSTADALTR